VSEAAARQARPVSQRLVVSLSADSFLSARRSVLLAPLHLEVSMSLPANWLRKLTRSTRTAPARRPRRPEVELLEDRWVPSATLKPTYVIHHGGGLSPYGSNPMGYTPAQIRHAYGIDLISFGGITGDGSGQTIAIIDAYDDPKFVNSTSANFVNSDLHKFDVQFGLPDPPSFRKVAQDGSSNYPAANAGWAGEIALDVEWAHAIAPGANILLVEANDASSDNLMSKAVTYAKQQAGVSVVTMSFGGPEFDGETGLDGIFTTPGGHGGVTFLASTGDKGAPGGYPAWSANVVAVGGTSLYLNNGNYGSESGWSGSGGGVSQYEAHPSFQNGYTSSGTRRATPDVSFVADPNTGVAVYDSYNGGSSPWLQYGGTSLSSPCFAGLIAIADQGRVKAGLGTLDSTATLALLYKVSAGDFHDITTGNNGYAAGVGYDLVTGRGSPVANLLVHDLATMAAPPPPLTYQLTRNGTLLAIQNGVSTVIDTNVETYGVTSAGQLFDLTNYGVFKQRVGGSWYQLDSNVQWICVGANGALYDLEKGGTLWASTVGTSWWKMDTQVESITMTPGGALFDLERGGNLWEFVNNSWHQIDSNVQQFAATPDGAIYDLQRGGTLYGAPAVGASWRVMDYNVRSIATTPSGGLFDLERGSTSQYGNLWEYFGGHWYQIDSNVQSFWATADGNIYDLQAGGTVWADQGGGWFKMDTGVGSFYATLGGQLYDLRRDGTLWADTAGSWFVMDYNVQTFYAVYNGWIYDLQKSGNLWANTGGAWFKMDSGVRSFSATLSGWLFDLQNGGTLWANYTGSWFKMDSGVKEFAATYWGWLYDLQNGGNFYANYSGSWVFIHSGVSSFVLNPNGSATYYY
jgi:hypothetical protein